MQAVAHSPEFAKKAGVPQDVGRDFAAADKSRKLAKGGDMASKMNPGFMAMMSKKKDAKPDALAKHAAKPASKAHKGLKSGGVTKAMPTPKTMGSMGMARGGGIEQRGKTKGKMMNRGGQC
jgi:hypothetical protein